VVGAAFCLLGLGVRTWFKFKGGDGVATSAGVLFGLMPLAALIGGVVWVFTFEVTRYVSVACVTTAVILPVAVLGLMHARHTNGMEMFYFSLCLAAVVVFRHRSNLSRLVHGTEPRFKRK